MSDTGSPPPPPPPPGSYSSDDDSAQPSGGMPPPPAYGSGAQPPYGAPVAYPPPPPGSPVVPGSGELSSWGRRAIGYIIDSLIGGVPPLILYLIGAVVLSSGSSVDPATGKLSGGNPAGGIFLFLGFVLALAINIWNRWIKGGKGQTIGRRQAGVTLLSQSTGQPIGTGLAFVRDIAHVLDSIICGLPIGWLWPLWDAKRQTWADKVMSTVVVNVPK